MTLQEGIITAGLSGATATAAGAELWQTIVVGLLGGLIAWLNQYDHERFKENKIKCIMSAPIKFATPVGMTGVVYYAGSDGAMIYFKDPHRMVWSFVGFIVAMYYKNVLVFFAGIAPSLFEKFGIVAQKPTNDEPMSDYDSDDVERGGRDVV